MKTEIIETQKKTNDFPALYKNSEGLVIFMIDERNEGGIGVVVVEDVVGDDFWSVGAYGEQWNMKALTKIETPVTITFKPEVCDE